MKRWIWLLALPYVVTASTRAYVGFGDSVHTYYAYSISSLFTCEKSETQTCEWLYDLADALNQAHEHRTQENKSWCPTCVITTEHK